MGGDLSEEELFQFSFSLDAADVKLFRSEFAWRRWSWGELVIPVFVLLGCVAAYWLALLVWPRLVHWPYFGAVVALPALAFFCWEFARGLLVGRAARLAGAGSIGVRTTTEGVELRLQTGQRLARWSEMKELLVTDAAIYVLLADGSVFVTPRRVFDDEGDAHVFASVVAKYAAL